MNWFRPEQKPRVDLGGAPAAPQVGARASEAERLVVDDVEILAPVLEPAAGRPKVVEAVDRSDRISIDFGRPSGGSGSRVRNGVQEGADGIKSLAEECDTADDLAKLGFEFAKQESAKGNAARPVNVTGSLTGKILPVAVTGEPDTFVLLVVKEHRNSFELSNVHRQATLQGWKARQPYSVVVVGQTLLTSLARGGESDSSAADRSGEGLHSSLWDAFVSIIKWGHQNGSADIDFQVNRNEQTSRIGFSFAGSWLYPEAYRMPTATMLAMLSVAYQRGKGGSEAQIDNTIEQSLRLYVDLGDREKVMLRWASMAGDTIYSVTVRIVRQGGTNGILTLDKLGYLPEHLDVLERVIRGEGGGIFMAGVVNSGKSVTINAMLDRIPSSKKQITIEDPVELFSANRISNTVARNLSGEPSPVMRRKLMNLKRTGFNVLFLGEIRDYESAKAAQDVFESGQTLYTTIHAGSAWEVPARLEGLGLPRHVLATPGNLRWLGYQALMPKLCGCATPLGTLASGAGEATGRWRAYTEQIQRLFDAPANNIRVRNLAGCDACRRSDVPEMNGWSGRVPVVEMIEPDEEFCELVSRNDSVGMIRYMRALRGGSQYDAPQMAGKSAHDCAVYKMFQGEIDPRSIEERFEAFATRQAKQDAQVAREAARAVDNARQRQPRTVEHLNG